MLLGQLAVWQNCVLISQLAGNILKLFWQNIGPQDLAMKMINSLNRTDLIRNMRKVVGVCFVVF